MEGEGSARPDRVPSGPPTARRLASPGTGSDRTSGPVWIFLVEGPQSCQLRTGRREVGSEGLGVGVRTCRWGCGGEGTGSHQGQTPPSSGAKGSP